MRPQKCQRMMDRFVASRFVRPMIVGLHQLATTRFFPFKIFRGAMRTLIVWTWDMLVGPVAGRASTLWSLACEMDNSFVIVWETSNPRTFPMMTRTNSGQSTISSTTRDIDSSWLQPRRASTSNEIRSPNCSEVRWCVFPFELCRFLRLLQGLPLWFED